MNTRSISPSASASPSKPTGAKQPLTQTILSQKAGSPASSAFLDIPETSSRKSQINLTLAHQLSSSQASSASSSNSCSTNSPAPTPEKKLAANSSNNYSPKPHHQSPNSQSRPTSSSSRFSRQNARDADVLGKILGWRHSRNLKTSHSFKSSPRSQSKQPYFKQTHSPIKQSQTSPQRLTKPTSPQELPDIFRPSNNRPPSSHLKSSQGSLKPLLLDLNQSHQVPQAHSLTPYLSQQSSSDLTSSTHASSNTSSSVTHASSSQTSFNHLPPSSTTPVIHLLSSPDGEPHHKTTKPSSALRRPVLKKSFSSGHLQRHFNLTHDASQGPCKPISQPSSFSPTLHSNSSPASPSNITELSHHQPATLGRPISLAIPVETDRLSSVLNSQLIDAPYASQAYQRFSLPSMHAVLDANSSLSRMIQLEHDSSDHSDRPAQHISPFPKHPSMHGVASNESIRTAKPSTEFKSLKSLSGFLPLAGHSSSSHDSHHNPSSDHDAPASSGPRPSRFQNPRVFDIFTPTHRRDPSDLMRRFLPPDLTGSSAPSETCSNPSQPQSLGVSVNSSLNSSHLLSPFANHNLSFHKDPRFAIWADNPAGAPHQQQSANVYPASRKRYSATVETRHYPHHPASASTSHLAIDYSTGHFTHASNTPSFGFSSPSGPPHSKRWSRSVKTPGSHSSNAETHSNSSPNLLSDVRHLQDDSTDRSSRDDLRQTHSTGSPGLELTPRLGHDRILMAATIERWVAELTTHIDSLGLVEFFYTYRAIMTPAELAQLLASRFEWAIMFRSPSYAQRLPDWNLKNLLVDPNLEKGILGLDGRLLSLDHDGETLRRVAKVRTFVMIRHWLLNHFEDDFLVDVALQTELHNWLENLIEKIKRVQRIVTRLDNVAAFDTDKPTYHSASTPSSFSGEDDLRILKNLRKVFKQLQAAHNQFFHVVVQEPSDSISHADHTDDQQQSRLSRKLPKTDVRELFKESDEPNAHHSRRRNRRSHTSDALDLQRSQPKTQAGHGRAHSVSTLAQVRTANFARSDLRLSELDDPHTDNLPEVLRDDDNPKQPIDDLDLSKSNEKLISKLKQVFESDTRRHRDGVHHQFHQKEVDSDPSRYSLSQANCTVPAQHRRQLMVARMRASDNSNSDIPNSHVATHPRSNLSTHTSASFNQGNSNLPQHHNPLHRYFTSTMGTIGRFKRMINNRSGPHLASTAPLSDNHYLLGIAGHDSYSPPSREPSSQSDQQTEVGDLLCAKGGLDRYLSFLEIQKKSSIGSIEDKLDKESIQMNSDGLSAAETADLGLENMTKLEATSLSPVVQYDDCSESQFSLSSSLSNTTSATQSMPSEHEGEANTDISVGYPVVVSTDVSGEQQLIAKSPAVRDEHPLHGSLSTETIKSEANHFALPAGGHHLALAGGGMDLLKKQLRKKFNNKDMCPVLMRASMTESFSGAVPEYSNSFVRHSEDSPRVNTFSINVSSPHDEKELDDRPMSVQLDDIDLLDSDEDSPVGVQKLRRLPAAVDLKQALAFGKKSLFNLKGGLMKGNDERSKRFSTETSSSIGTRRVPSIAASMFRRSKLSHASSILNSTTSSLAPSRLESSPSQQHDTEMGTPGVVANFVADGLESDDDEPGDVEAALRRLEGVIDADREKEKARKVELQMIKSMQASRRTRKFSRTTGSQYSFNSQTEAYSESTEGDLESEGSDNDNDDDEEEEEEEEEEREEEEQNGQEEKEEQEGEEREEEQDQEDRGGLEQERLLKTQLCRKSMSILLDRSGLNSPIAEADEDELDTKSAPTPKLSPIISTHAESFNPPASNLGEKNLTLSTPPTAMSNNLVPAPRSGMRFLSDHSKGSSLDNLGMVNGRCEDHSKTLRGNGKRLATRSQQVMSRKGSLHKLFSTTHHPPKSSDQIKPKGSSGSIPPPSYNYPTSGKPTIMHSLPLPPLHRSFLLDCRTEILAQQFCLIERDLLRNITWQELLLSKWQEDRSSAQHHGNLNGGSGLRGTRKKKGVSGEDAVTCWETFMKQRAKEKMRLKGRILSHQNLSSSNVPDGFGMPTKKLDGTEINALIMRFNLTCNWVASELVLTFNLDERVALLGKFIRLAFKCYRQNNFQTLTQIIHGLQTPYVERLKKTWSKLGIWESRMFRDLKEFTSHLSNFKSLRNVQDSLISDLSSNLGMLNQTNNPSTANGSSPSLPNPGGTTAHFLHNSEIGASRNSHTYSRAGNSINACIPFLGLYLRDLTVNDELPTYLDPTDPSIPVEIDRATGKLKKLSNPRVFEELPLLGMMGGVGVETSELSDYGYYPLVNVNKLRTYAKIILKIIEFQNRSIKNYTFETDSKWFLTCLKIKCLSSEQLRLLSRTCEA